MIVSEGRSSVYNNFNIEIVTWHRLEITGVFLCLRLRLLGQAVSGTKEKLEILKMAADFD